MTNERTGLIQTFDATRSCHLQLRVRELADGSIEQYETSTETWQTVPASVRHKIRWVRMLGLGDLGRANEIAEEFGCYLEVVPGTHGKISAQVLPKYRTDSSEELLSETLHKIGRALEVDTSEVLR